MSDTQFESNSYCPRSKLPQPTLVEGFTNLPKNSLSVESVKAVVFFSLLKKNKQNFSGPACIIFTLSGYLR